MCGSLMLCYVMIYIKHQNDKYGTKCYPTQTQPRAIINGHLVCKFIGSYNDQTLAFVCSVPSTLVTHFFGEINGSCSPKIKAYTST